MHLLQQPAIIIGMSGNGNKDDISWSSVNSQFIFHFKMCISENSAYSIL